MYLRSQEKRRFFMKRLNVRFIALVFLALVFVAPADEAAAQGQGFYLGVFGGYVMPDDMKFTTTPPGVSYDISTDDTGIMGVKFGWVPPTVKYLALEMELGYIFESNYGPTTNYGVTMSGDVYLSNVMFNLLFRYPTGKIHPYLGAGIGWSYFNVEGVESDGRFLYYVSEDDYAFAWQFLAGVDFEIANNMSIDLGYRYFGTDPNLTITEIEYRANIFTVGLNFRF
jgi:opacity protein-like surface antigen